MSCRHNLAIGTCVRCYPSNPFRRVAADRIDPGPESSDESNLEGPGAITTDEHASQVLKNRIAKLLWQQASCQKNPWFSAAASRLEGYRERWNTWHMEQIALLHQLAAVVFGEVPADDTLLKRALDFIERAD